MKILVLFLSLLLASCSFINEDDGKREKLEHPDLVMEKANYTLGQKDEEPIFITADRIEFHSKDNLAYTDKLSFIQYNEDGDIKLQGRADKATINTDKKTLDLSGNVELEELENNMTIYSDTLFFDSENGMINAPENVSVSSEDGKFKGSDFNADLLTKTYSFGKIDEGIFL